jgi:hypothetical protein
MCNCGHDVCDTAEAESLKKKAVVTAAGAAALAGIPAVLATGTSHHGVLGAVIALQAVFIVRAVYLVRQRKVLLAGRR